MEFQRIPGGLVPEAETLDAKNPSDFLESGACERFPTELKLHIFIPGLGESF